MLTQIFATVGIEAFTVHVNDRKILTAICLQAGFKEEDVASVLISLDKFDKIGLDGIRKELVENGYAEEVVDKYLAIYENLKESSCTEFCKDVVGEFLDQSVVDAMEEIVSCARSMVNENVTIMFDPTLVRGMGYYTGPIFEITIDGYGFSIAGGGRYDKMIGKFSGQDVCASGFSIGFERIITILKDKFEDEMKISDNNLAILIEKGVPTEKKMELFAKAKDLRAAGTTVTIQPMKKNMKQQIALLEKEGYTQFEKVYRR
jgi:histidyl-tRNA synthetase